MVPSRRDRTDGLGCGNSAFILDYPGDPSPRAQDDNDHVIRVEGALMTRWGAVSLPGRQYLAFWSSVIINNRLAFPLAIVELDHQNLEALP